MDSHFTTGCSRLDAVLAKLGRVRRVGRNYTSRCPAHDDHQASLSIGLGDDGKVFLHCFAGCEFKAIVAALDLPMSTFFADAEAHHVNGRSNGHENGNGAAYQRLTLDDLAVHKKLPVEFLEALGWRDEGGRVVIPYYKADGTVFRVRYRFHLIAKKGTSWGPGNGSLAYDPDLGSLRKAQGYVVLGEGETDVATLLFAGFPAIGIPGATNTGTLEREHFEGVNHVFAIQETDKAGEGFPKRVQERLDEIGIDLRVHTLRMPNGAKDPSALYQRNPEAFPETFRALLKHILEPPPHPLHALWKSVGEWGLLDTEPPPQEWVLMRPDLETNGMANPIGLLPRSEVGFLIAAGGVGKSFALIQLALSVATGRKWLDYFLVPTPGRVLILLGEEKLKQAHRRFHDLAHSMRLTDEQVALAKANIVMMPLAGVIAPLVVQDGTSTSETDVMAFLRQHMAEAEWMLVIIDPLSRFAGADTEKDNVQATRFVQVAETLCKVPGAPTVLFAHHTNKASRVDGAPAASAADARGASGTTDGGRWCANLVRRKGGASLSFTKNNYGQDFDETLPLERAFGGYLRVQSEEARERAREVEAAREAARTAEVRAKLRAALHDEPGLSKNKLRVRVNVGDAEVRTTVDQMERDGELFQQPQFHYHLRSKSDE